MSLIKRHTKHRKEVTKRTLRFCVEACLVLISIVIILYTVRIFEQYRTVNNNSEKIEPGVSYSQANNFTTIVLGEETGVETEQNNAVHHSENYKTKLVIFGGNAALPMGEDASLKINDVKSELLTTRNQQEIKLYVSWKTNKLAVSELNYGKNLGQGGKSIEEDNFGYVHSTILPSLDPSSAYTYRIKGQDKWGNKVESQQFAFYTGAPNVSLLDLLLGAFKDVFGWAMKG